MKNLMKNEKNDGYLHKLFTYFRNNIEVNLTQDKFVDIFIQSIICSLGAVKIILNRDFSVPHISTMFSANPICKKIFRDLFPSKTTELSQFLFEAAGLQETVEFLTTFRFNRIFLDSIKNSDEIDPITQFYELFLHSFNFQETYKRGVFHTPHPIVDFIVKETDFLLRTELNNFDGLADKNIQLLDPATGTGIFLESSIKFIESIFNTKYKTLNPFQLKSAWIEYISNYLIHKIKGFELLLTPFFLAHLKLGLLFKEFGYEFSTEERLDLYLTNTLDVPLRTQELEKLSKENFLAKDIKSSQNISVVLGNPPYARSSQNTGPYIARLMDSYKDAVRNEKNIQPLSDDYIKFFRIAQDFIERKSSGIIGFITNHSYLAGIIHRGMREELMKAFDCIYIIDLHGSKIIHENVPGKVKDENVFRIKQGVCIGFFIKNPNRKTKKIYHYDLYGTRKHKLDWLSEKEISTIPWSDISNILPGAPLMTPIEESLKVNYQKFVNLTEIFEFYNVGGKPGDDELLISFKPQEVITKLQALIEKIQNKQDLGRITEAKTKLLQIIDKFELDSSKIKHYNYRPFDYRWTYYDPTIWTRPVRKLKLQCNEKPMLLCSRIVKDDQFAHIFASNHFTDVIFLSNTSSVNCYVFPLIKKDLNGTERWNLLPKYLDYLKKMGLNITNLNSIDPMAYLYSILFSNKYRSRYAPLLKRNFPRIPFITNRQVFSQLLKLGRELLTIHLYPAKFEIHQEIKTNIKNGNIIKKGFPKFDANQIYINPDKWVSGINRTIWNFKIGKYQVCKKWLRDRSGRKINDDEIVWYCRILSIVRETLRIMQAIDTIINLQINYKNF